MFSLMVIVRDGFKPLEVPLQPINPNPILGVAVIVISVPDSKVPEVGETLPPVPAEAVRE